MAFWSALETKLVRAVRSTVGGAIDNSSTGRALAQQTAIMAQMSEQLARLADRRPDLGSSPPAPDDANRMLVEPLRAVAAALSTKPADLAAALHAIDDPERNHDSPVYWDLFQARSLLSYAVWDHFGAVAAAHYRRNRTASVPIEQTGVLDGQLPARHLDALLEAWEDCAPCRYEARDFAPDAMFNPWIFGISRTQFNEFADYRRSSPKMLEAIGRLLADQQDMLDQAMGHYWAVAGVKLVSLHPLGTDVGPHIWHSDSHPACMKKLMIYLCDTGPETGSTEFELHGGGMFRIEGPAGRWVLFENARVRHRGLPPQVRPRPVVELTFMPALETTTRVVDTGLNEGYPWFPPIPAASDSNGHLAGAAARERILLRAVKLGLDVGNVSAASAGIDSMIPRP